MKLVEVDAIAIRHNHPVEDDGHTSLLTEPCGTNFPGFTKYDGSVRNNNVLMIVRIRRVGHQHLDRPSSIAIQSIHENRVQNRALV